MRELSDTANPPSIDEITSHILIDRSNLNKNNISRTNYYLEYWLENPEIPWALAANLVSRNAGYTMSDFKRYQEYEGELQVLLEAAGGISALEGALAGEIGFGSSAAAMAMLQAGMIYLFEFMEAGNFLIFGDVFPYLEAYRYAKTYAPKDTNFNGLGGEIFDLFKTDPTTSRTKFGPPIISQIIDPSNNHSGKLESYFSNQMWQQWSQGSIDNTNPDVQELFLLQVCEEQTFIENRLVKDGTNRLGRVAKYSTTFLQFLFKIIFKANKVGIPLDTSGKGIADKIVINKLQDFTCLNQRIGEGRTILSILANPKLYEYIGSWVNQHQKHYGTRVDYNTQDYTVDLHSANLTSPKYSPPLWPYLGYCEVWPLDPGSAHPGLHAPAENDNTDWSKEVNKNSNWIDTTSIKPMTETDNKSIQLNNNFPELPQLPGLTYEL